MFAPTTETYRDAFSAAPTGTTATQQQQETEPQQDFNTSALQQLQQQLQQLQLQEMSVAEASSLLQSLAGFSFQPQPQSQSGQQDATPKSHTEPEASEEDAGAMGPLDDEEDGFDAAYDGAGFGFTAGNLLPRANGPSLDVPAPSPAEAAALAAVVLPRQWTFWAAWHLSNTQVNVNEMQQVGECHNLADCWDNLGKLAVEDMPNNVTFHLFKHGSTPVVTHPDNVDGGHFKIRAASPEAASRLWVWLTLAVVTDKLPHHDQLNGVSVVKKSRSITLQLWVGVSTAKPIVDTLKLFLSASLPAEDHFRVKFCSHKYLLNPQPKADKSRSLAGNMGGMNGMLGSYGNANGTGFPHAQGNAGGMNMGYPVHLQNAMGLGQGQQHGMHMGLGITIGGAGFPQQHQHQHSHKSRQAHAHQHQHLGLQHQQLYAPHARSATGRGGFAAQSLSASHDAALLQHYMDEGFLASQSSGSGHWYGQ